MEGSPLDGPPPRLPLAAILLLLVHQSSGHPVQMNAEL
jgi:hypothetical protein